MPGFPAEGVCLAATVLRKPNAVVLVAWRVSIQWCRCVHKACHHRVFVNTFFRGGGRGVELKYAFLFCLIAGLGKTFLLVLFLGCYFVFTMLLAICDT